MVPMVTLPLMGGLQVKLGMIAPKAPPRVLRFKSFLTAPVWVPETTNYYDKARASLNRMYRNNVKGCCVITGKFHTLGVWTANDGATTLVVSDSVIDRMYAKLAVYPGQDSGCIISDVLDYFAATGLPDDAGVLHKIDGYVSIDWRNPTEVKVATLLFGALTIGFSVTNQMVRTAKEGAVWDSFNPNDVAGGHDVSVVGFTATGVQVSTWGVVLTMTWPVFAACVSECYAILAPDWYGSDKVNAATGVDFATLKADLDKLRVGVIPDPTPIPVPPPVGPPVVPPVGPTTYTFTGTMTGTMVPTNQPAGSWLTDIGEWGRVIMDRACEMHAKYGPAADDILAAARAFADAPGFGTGAELWAAIQVFERLVSPPATSAVPVRAIDWQSLIQFAEAVAELIARFV